MLTLRELRELVMEGDPMGKVPSARALLDSDIPVVVKEVMENGVEIAVYANGYVLYRIGKHATVFLLHNCDCYNYGSAAEEGECLLQRDVFEDENWYIRLILEGEDRLEHNQNVRNAKKCVSYSAVSEEWKLMATEDSVIGTLLEEETARETLDGILLLLTEKQKYVLLKLFVDGVEQAQLAKELGVTQQAVSDMLRKAKRRIIRAYGSAGQDS